MNDVLPVDRHFGSPEKPSKFLEQGPRHVDSPTPLDKTYESALQVLHEAIVFGTDARAVKEQVDLARSKLQRLPPDFRNRQMYLTLCRETLQDFRDSPLTTDAELNKVKDQIAAVLDKNEDLEKRVNELRKENEKLKPPAFMSFKWIRKWLFGKGTGLVSGAVVSSVTAFFFRSSAGVAFCDLTGRVVELKVCR